MNYSALWNVDGSMKYELGPRPMLVAPRLYDLVFEDLQALKYLLIGLPENLEHFTFLV